MGSLSLAAQGDVKTVTYEDDVDFEIEQYILSR